MHSPAHLHSAHFGHDPSGPNFAQVMTNFEEQYVVPIGRYAKHVFCTSTSMCGAISALTLILQHATSRRPGAWMPPARRRLLPVVRQASSLSPLAFFLPSPRCQALEAAHPPVMCRRMCRRPRR